MLRKSFIPVLQLLKSHWGADVSASLKPSSLFVQKKNWCHNQIKVSAESVPVSQKDQVLEALKAATSFPEIMLRVEQNKEQLNSQVLESVFVKLYDLARDQPTLINKMKSELQFQMVCNYALKHIRQFSPNEIFNLVRTMCFLDMPLNCTLGQASLQMLRHYINDLSLVHIVILDRIFKDQPSNPLVDALKKALLLAFEIQVEYQLDPENPKIVINCLDMVIRQGMESKYLEKLSIMILRHAETLPKEQAVAAAIFFSHVKDPFSYLQIKHTVREVLSRLCHLAMDLSPQEADKLMFALRRNKILLSHSKLLSALSHKCIVQNWDLQRTCTLLSVYNVQKFVSSSLLDHVLNTLRDDPAPLVENELVNLAAVIEAFSEANHSIDRDLFTELIQKCDKKMDKLESESPDVLVKLAMHLAIMECLPTWLMGRVFQPEFIAKAIKSAAEKQRESSLLQCYLALEQAARLEHANSYQGPFLPPDLIREAIKVRSEVMKPIDLVLQEFLEVGLGGPQFMLSGLWTKLGHFVDHLVVMRKEDFPVTPTNNQHPLVAEKSSDGFAFVEDVPLPENARVLAVLVARREWFNHDPPSLRGWTAFQQRTLARMGYNPVIIGPPVENTDQMQDIDCRLESESY